MIADYKILNYDDTTWKDFLKEKQKRNYRARDFSSHFRINSAQQSNPFMGSSNPNICFSLDKKRGSYRIGEMSAPGSANSFSMQMGNRHKRRPYLNSNVKIQPILKQDPSIPVKLEANNKNFIDWKVIAVNTNDLENEEKDQLEFSPPYVDSGLDNDTSSLPKFNPNSKSLLLL